jgi:hypothetical protein
MKVYKSNIDVITDLLFGSIISVVGKSTMEIMEPF